MSTTADKIKDIEDEMAKTQKNKATAKVSTLLRKGRIVLMSL